MQKEIEHRLIVINKLYDFRKSGKVEGLKIGQILQIERITRHYRVYLGNGHFSKQFSILKYAYNFLKYYKNDK
jgi:hypothetical protein